MGYEYPSHHLQMILPYLRYILPSFLFATNMVSDGGNHSKSRIVAFGESKPQHFESMKNRVWLLGDTIVDLCEHKNLGLLKNYVASFPSNV